MLSKLYKKHTEVFIIALILILGIILRIMWISLVPTVPVSDFLVYHQGAISIITGKGYRMYGYLSAFEPIGYSAFLALIYFIFGSALIVGKTANIVLSVIGMIFLYLIVKKGFNNKKIAYICIFLYSILPLNIIYSSVISTEILFTTMFLILMYMTINSSNKKYSSAIMGILLGVLSLIKPYMMIYQFAILVFDFIASRSIKKPLKKFLVITFFMALTISPWTIRNYLVFHKVIPISTNGGYNLYVNNNPYATGSWQNPFNIPDSPLLKYKNPNDKFWNEVKVDEDGKKYAFQWIKSNPLQFCKIGFIKLKNVFLVPDTGHWSTVKLENNQAFKYDNLLAFINTKIHYFTIIVMYVYFILLVVNLILKRTKDLKLHLIIIMNVLFYVAITFVFEGQSRYLFPLWPLLICGVVYTFEDIFSLFYNRYYAKSESING